MKKVISVILSCILMLTMFGCGNANTPPETTGAAVDAKYTVPSPMTTRVYTFDAEPTPEQLRQTAIQAMRDLLSIQWCTDETIACPRCGRKH